jgi:hypothetical protein
MKQNDRQLGEMLYTKLTEVTGRWQADILENYLKSEEIDAVLFQDTLSHVTFSDVFAVVEVYVPKASIQRARELLEKFNATEDEGQE